jgi:solute carrier family 25 S-adenosylmethionine transporter 26
MHIASLFFVTYEASKRLLGASTESNTPFTYMVAATFGEIVSFSQQRERRKC